jgi:hypothetical protein
MSNQAARYPVFRYVNGRLIPGFGPRQMAVFAVVALVGAVLFFATGLITTVRSIELSPAEAMSEESRLKEIRNMLYSEDLLTHMATDETVSFFDEASGARQVVFDEARLDGAKNEVGTLGITKDTTDSELVAKIPHTKERVVQVMPTFARILVFLIVPMTLTVALLIEMGQGFTLRDEVARWLSWRRNQSLFRYKNRYSDDYADTGSGLSVTGTGGTGL